MAYIVYILVSKANPTQHYVGITENLEGRLQEHNLKKVGYTKHYAPWEIETHITFQNKERAIKFEKYLKAGSGYAFLKRHLI